ncbi:cell division protein FtsZ [Candidatus Symbiothrix dinenymphae]|nr:cell division protein FtsZ [Candidatus Symbiothrix dinenymphae]
MDDILKGFIFEKVAFTEQPAIIKVIGVGGGGSNAVKHMYDEGIKDVTFALCNTDLQALIKSNVPKKLQLGQELTDGEGAGADSEVGKKAAEESTLEIQAMLRDGTKMVLITAGMGGGTGTGAAPVVAQIAKGMGILTIGIVTIPFIWEGAPKILSALRGVEEMEKNVDALLIINNELLKTVYPDLDVDETYKRADDVLATAAKSIAEIITIEGTQNLDFADVRTTLKDGNVAIMNNGFGEGEGRVYKAFNDAVNSPLLNNRDVFKAKRILFNICYSSEKRLLMPEMDDIKDYMLKFDKNIHVIWGLSKDESLGDKVKITVLASGYDVKSVTEADSFTETRNLLDEEAVKKAQEDAKAKAAAAAKKAQEEKDNEKKIGKYYPDAPTKPKSFIFTSVAQMDNDEVIEALLTHPTYERKPDVMRKAVGLQ